jgi:diaminohydroxyphosphoribosylaminopyrimidine deaminase/5-amino-6-(5-phosphoribosylamino)uracil reductase
VAPNPTVGCVIVSPEGHVVGRGWTQPGGRPHAETIALAAAGPSARGATAYVSLEPCAHEGRTPPCATALVKAGVGRVVGAVEDPDPRVQGKGFAMLRAAGIEVSVGTLAEEAAALNAGFFLSVTRKRPLVTLKIAQSLDGKTASASGKSQWITGEEARRFGHLLRAQNDAILVGIETVLADDPALDCRIAGLTDRSPVRVVLDSKLRLSETSRIAKSAAKHPTLVFAAAGQGDDRLRTTGIEIVRVMPDAQGRPDIAAVLAELGKRGITRLLVEGGAIVHASFLDRGLADRLEVFTAPMTLGNSAKGGIGVLKSATLEGAPRFARTGTRLLGRDLLESFAVRA